MLMRTGSERARSVFCWLAASALLLTVLALPSAVAAVELTQVKAPGDCNSNLSIAFSPAMPAVGGTVAVTLTISNDPDTQDVGGMLIGQDFATVSYFPSCLSTIPCVVDPAMPASFVPGSQSTTCGPGTMKPNDAGGQVDFNFTPAPGFTIAPAGSPGDSCTISFDVQIDPAAMNGATVMSEATTAGICTIGGAAGTNVSASTDTAVYSLVPTLGQIALAILALLLAVGSWHILRRRHAVPLA